MKYLIHSLIIVLGSLSISCDKAGGDVNPQNIDNQSKSSSSYNSNLLKDYAEMQLLLISNTPGYSAPVAARSIGYLSMAAYATVSPGINGQPTLNTVLPQYADIPLPEPNKKYHWGIATNAGQQTLMKLLYETTGDVFKARVDSLSKRYNSAYEIGTDIDVVTRSINYGNEVAKYFWEKSKKDNGHAAYNNNFPTSNNVFTSASKWLPTGSQKNPLLPQWEKVNSMVLANQKLAVAKPIIFSFKADSDFFKEAKQVVENSKSLSEDELKIVQFWEDPTGTMTSAGHYFSLITDLISKENYSLDKAAILQFKVGIALHDTYVMAWKNKYTHNIMRPETYIKNSIDPTWTPNISSPDYPDYISEKSALSKAVSTILHAEFGENYVFEDNARPNKYSKRAFKGFESMTEEVISAEVMAGTSFPISILDGAEQGRKIAENILALPLTAIPTVAE